MANDSFDAAGLQPGAAEWTLTPDQGITLDGAYRSPNHGGDVSKTDARSPYPSQEPRDAAPYDPDLQAIVNAYNAGAMPTHGADMKNTSAAGPGQDWYNRGLEVPADVNTGQDGNTQTVPDSSAATTAYPAQGYYLGTLDGPAAGRM